MKKTFKTLLFVLVLSLFVFPNTTFAKTITLKKDTVMKTQLTGDNVTITGKHKLTLKKGARIKGKLIIKGGATVVSAHPGIKAKNITISGAKVNSKNTQSGTAIEATEKLTIKNSTIEATANSYGLYGMDGHEGVTITGSKVTARADGDYSLAGIASSNKGITIEDSVLEINGIEDGIFAYDGIFFNNVKATIHTGYEGLATIGHMYLFNSFVNIDGGNFNEDETVNPNGIYAYDAVVIDGGKLVVSSKQSDGIYAGNLIQITNNTYSVNVSGKEYGLHVDALGGGVVNIGDLLFVEPNGSSFDSTKGYMVNGTTPLKSMTIVNPNIDEPVFKEANTLKVKTSAKTVKYSALKKSSKVVSAIKIEKKNGIVTYEKVDSGSSSKLSVDNTTGKITVKKKTKKGTYKIKVKVTASGDKSHRTSSKTVTVTIKVK